MTQSPSVTDVDHNLPVFSVGELSQALKGVVEETFAWVRVRGEISGFKRAASGHCYMALKDADAVLDGVCWRGTAQRLALQPEDGMEVIATGRITTYPGRSKYQIVIEAMELAGEGALLKLLEERKRRLAEEGLFDEARKRPLPFLPEVIGVVTSPTGAVIRDILHRLADRFPRRVILWPVLVQGDGAAAEIAAAIRGFGALAEGGAVPRPDLLIVARGGGSLEDLWAFNEEEVARAAADCAIPLIAAVGHETDVTLIDFVADRRAPTPTAAAEMAVPVRMELLAQVLDDGTRLVAAVNRLMAERRTRVDGLARGLPNLRRMLEESAQRLDDWGERLANSLKVGLDRRRARLLELAARLPGLERQLGPLGDRVAREGRALETALRMALRDRRARLTGVAALLESCSYERVLERGFALVFGESRQTISSARQIAPGDALTLHFHDGEAGAVADGESAPPKSRARRDASADTRRDAPRGRRRSRPRKDGRQGELL